MQSLYPKLIEADTTEKNPDLLPAADNLGRKLARVER